MQKHTSNFVTSCLTDTESIDSEGKLLVARTGKVILFSLNHIYVWVTELMQA